MRFWAKKEKAPVHNLFFTICAEHGINLTDESPATDI